MQFKNTGNVYTVNKNGLEFSDECIEFAKIVDEFAIAYMESLQMEDEDASNRIILEAEEKMRKKFNDKNATFYYMVDTNNGGFTGGLIISNKTKKIYKAIIGQIEANLTFEIIESGIEYNEWTTKELNFVELFVAALGGQDFTFDGKPYIVTSVDENIVLYDQKNHTGLELKIMTDNFLIKSLTEMEKDVPDIYVLILDAFEADVSGPMFKQDYEGEFVWYDYNADGTEEKWIVLYNNEEVGLQIVSANTIGTMTFGDSSGNVRTIIESFNNAYNNVNEKCRSLVTENTYKESVRFFGSKLIDTDNVSYDTVAYTLDGVEYEAKKVNETFSEDSGKVSRLGITLPEEYFIKADIKNYTAQRRICKRIFRNN